MNGWLLDPSSLRGRIAGPAYHAVAEHIIEDGDAYVLEAAGKRWPITNAA